VERELGLHGGFWGSVAAGVLFGGMTIVSGRQRPHAAERSKATMRANGDLMLQAEVVAGALDAIVAEDADADAQYALKRLTAAQAAVRIGPLPLDGADVRRVCAALRGAAARWQGLPPGSPLVLRWDVHRVERRRPSGRDRRRGRRDARLPAGVA
ncbi:MAG TPA: hypothetical protein VH916_08760, partial [Dehalococcoidia bacterium]